MIIALLGIASTLALSVTERTRELGLLRAIGMRRSQVGQMIAAESVIIAVIGAVLGTALGVSLGSALAVALTRSQQVTVSVPGGQIVICAAAAVAAGLLAAIAPRTPGRGHEHAHCAGCRLTGRDISMTSSFRTTQLL